VDDRDELSRRLWLLRDQMEQLVCALDIQQLVLANNRLRWLPMVTENVEHLVDDIRLSEAERVVVSRRIARELGLSEDASLNELASAAGEPYAMAWKQHRLHLISLQAEVEEISSMSRDLGRRGLNATREVMTSIGGERTTTYDPSGGSHPLQTSTSRRFEWTA
jgi:hypothetical protein